jgi:hypothetical protein
MDNTQNAPYWLHDVRAQKRKVPVLQKSQNGDQRRSTLRAGGYARGAGQVDRRSARYRQIAPMFQDHRRECHRSKMKRRFGHLPDHFREKPCDHGLTGRHRDRMRHHAPENFAPSVSGGGLCIQVGDIDQGKKRHCKRDRRNFFHRDSPFSGWARLVSIYHTPKI